MSAFSIPIQTVIYGLLTADAQLMTLVGANSVLTATRQDQPFPYIAFGKDSHTDWSTDDIKGSSTQIAIDTWTAEGVRGFQEVKTIQDRIQDVLDRASYTIAGYNVVSIDYNDSEAFQESDGLTYHGVSTFTILIQDS